jgi:hypothetical protein
MNDMRCTLGELSTGDLVIGDYYRLWRAALLVLGDRDDCDLVHFVEIYNDGTIVLDSASILYTICTVQPIIKVDKS